MSIKRGNLLKIILGCVLFLSIALFGINLGYTPASADGTFTITSVSQTTKESEMYAFKLNASGYSTSEGYNHLSKEVDENINVYDKIELNGKSITEWNTEYSETAAGWTFGWFPANSAGFYYKMPIVMRGYKGVMRMYIHENMYSIIVAEYGNMIVQLKAGLSAEGYTLAEDTGRYKVIDNSGIPASGNAEVMPDTVEISPDNVSVSEWTQTQGIKAFFIGLGSCEMPSSIGYGIIDNDTYKYIADYITINGKTITWINANTNVDGWTWQMPPSTFEGNTFKVPVILYITTEKIEIRIHDNYYATLGGTLNVSVLKDLTIVNGTNEYVLADTASSICKYGTWSADWQTVEIQAADVSITGWTQTQGIKAFFIGLGSCEMSSSIRYGIIDNDTYKYIADYITINGKTITWINANTNVDGWTWQMAPSTFEGNTYKLPIIVYVENGKITVRMHDNYYATLGGTLNVSVLKDLTIVNGTNEYVLADTASSICKYGTWSADWQTVELQSSDVSVTGWTQTHGITAFFVGFSGFEMPSSIGYGIIDNDTYKYIADYITINGKTITWINANTNVDGWTWQMPPSTNEGNKYKLPIIVYVEKGKITVRMHDNYYAVLPSVQVSVLEGLTIVNDATEYVLNSTANYRRKSGQWLDLNYEYSIVYYVNGEVYATDKYKLDETVVMHAAPTVDQGYEFSGWDKTINKVSGDEEVRGTIIATTYNITYKLGGGKNSPQNPLKYTIEDETIVLKDATKDGCSFLGWYDADGNKVEQIEAGSYGDIVLNAKFTEESGGGCSSNVSGDVFGYVALLLCAAMILTLKRVGKKADK